MSHEKSDFPNCSGPDKLADHRLRGSDATPDRAAIADQIDDGFAHQLFQGMRHDPSVPLTNFAPRAHSPTLKAWIQHEPSGPCPYVDGQNLYAAPVDEPVNPINPLGDLSL